MTRAPGKFKCSTQLKLVFNQEFDKWQKKNRLGLEDLANRCGASTQYLSHIGRYGRIPGKPILILLAFNFGLPSPRLLFDAADLGDPWPYDEDLALRPPSASQNGFISLNVDMTGFTQAIREIVKTEIKPKTLQDLLRGRSLRIGLNRGQAFLFKTAGQSSKPPQQGFVPELLHLSALSLCCEFTLSDVHHSACFEQFNSDKLDIYGPIYSTPKRLGQALYTDPFCLVKQAGIVRTRKCGALSPLPPPAVLEDLRKRAYTVAVLNETSSHHFALSELDLDEARLLVCQSAEECIERITLSGIPRPAHVLLCDAPAALLINENSAEGVKTIFPASDLTFPPFENSIAIRPDWPTVQSQLNDALSLIKRTGTLRRLYETWIPKNLQDYITLPPMR